MPRKSAKKYQAWVAVTAQGVPIAASLRRSQAECARDNGISNPIHVVIEMPPLTAAKMTAAKMAAAVVAGHGEAHHIASRRPDVIASALDVTNAPQAQTRDPEAAETEMLDAPSLDAPSLDAPSLDAPSLANHDITRSEDRPHEARDPQSVPEPL